MTLQVTGKKPVGDKFWGQYVTEGWFMEHYNRICITDGDGNLIRQGLTPSEYTFLIHVSRFLFLKQPINVSRIAEGMGFTTTQVHKIKRKLQQDGLLLVQSGKSQGKGNRYDITPVMEIVAQYVPADWFNAPSKEGGVITLVTRGYKLQLSGGDNHSYDHVLDKDREESIVTQAKPMSPAPPDEPTSTPPTTQLIADAGIPKSDRLWFLVNRNGNDLDKPKQQDPPPTATCWYTGKTPRSAWMAQDDGKTWLQMDKTMFICYIGYGWRWSAPEELKTQLVDKMTNVWRGHRGKGSLFSTCEWADFFAAAAAIPAGLSYESPKVWLPKLQAALSAREKQAAKKTASQAARQNPRPNGLILITDEAIEYGRKMTNGNNNES